MPEGLPHGGLVESLYLHVPFCARKCSYCAFYSEVASPGLVDRYLSAALRELEQQVPRLRPRTVYFGGGTPTLLREHHWEQLFDSFLAWFPEAPAEWTVECNPATLSLDKARLLRAGGVNRISLGAQSFDPGVLARLGRLHTREDVFRAFDQLRQAGFDNVGLDLMFAVPGQDLASWRDTVQQALALECEHLSSYEVTYEEDTPLYEQLQAGAFRVDEDLACQMYRELQEALESHGLRQYEVANFARGPLDPSTGLPARACRHNVNYWRGGSFLGLGPSASSFHHAVRWKNVANTESYCTLIEQGRSPVESRDELTPLARAGEIAAFGLRMVIGWRFDEFQRTTGFDLRTDWRNELEELQRLGWATEDDTGFRLTREGLRFADAVAEQLLR